MTDEHQPLPVQGYTPQSSDKVALVNEFKQDEERLLRKIDALDEKIVGHPIKSGGTLVDQGLLVVTGYRKLADAPYDPYWLMIARQHFSEGFMALNRAVFQPQRIRLPEDDGNAPRQVNE